MKLRPAVLRDAIRLFEWRNDPMTQRMSRSPEPVHWDDHVAWLQRRLQREEPGLFIAEQDGEAVGTVRIDGDEISYTVAPRHRGKGAASAMLTEAHRLFGPKRAEIKPENKASIAAAQKAGHEVVLI